MAAVAICRTVATYTCSTITQRGSRLALLRVVDGSMSGSNSTHNISEVS